MHKFLTRTELKLEKDIFYHNISSLNSNYIQILSQKIQSPGRRGSQIQPVYSQGPPINAGTQAGGLASLDPAFWWT